MSQQVFLGLLTEGGREGGRAAVGLEGGRGGGAVAEGEGEEGVGGTQGKLLRGKGGREGGREGGRGKGRVAGVFL